MSTIRREPLHRDPRLHTQCPHDPHDRGEAGVAVLGQRLVKTFAAHPDVTGQQTHVLRPCDIVQSGTDQAAVARVFLRAAIRGLEERRSEFKTDRYYGTVAAALLWTLEQGLGDLFTSEVNDAWTATYAVLAGTMKDAAAEVVGGKPVRTVSRYTQTVR